MLDESARRAPPRRSPKSAPGLSTATLLGFPAASATMLTVSHDLAVIAHLCERIGVMSRGQLLEITTATAMASNQETHDYTRQLLRSNAGYDRNGVVSGFARRALVANKAIVCLATRQG